MRDIEFTNPIWQAVGIGKFNRDTVPRYPALDPGDNDRSTFG